MDILYPILITVVMAAFVAGVVIVAVKECAKWERPG